MNRVIFFKLQLKRFCKLIPAILIGTVILSAFAVIVIFCATKLNNASNDVEKKSIVFSSKDNSPLTSIIVSSLSQSESINTFFHIEELTEKDAIQKVKSDKAVAAVVIPKNFMGSIMSGDNYAIDIYFSDESSLYSLVLTEISLAAQNSLKAAQSAIYTEYDYYSAIGMRSKEQQATDSINTSLITDALSRGKLFQKHIINSSTGIDLKTFYICSAISMILLLLGCIFILKIKNTKSIISVKLRQNGIGAAGQIVTDTIAIWITYQLTLLIAEIVLLILNTTNVLTIHLRYTNILLCSSIVILFVSQIILLASLLFKDAQTSILFVFVFAVVCTFLSGGFIPSDLLPMSIVKLSAWIPTTYMIRIISHVFTKGWNLSEFGYLLIFTFIIFIANILLKNRWSFEKNHRRANV